MNAKVATRYAKALFKLADDNQEVESLRLTFEALQPMLLAPSRFMYWLASPQIDPQVKKNLLERLAGNNGSQTLKNFLFLLWKKHRLQDLPEIIKEYQRMAADKLGMLHVRLISAIQLDEHAKSALSQKIEAKYRKKPVYAEEIDPSLIAGNVIFISNQMIDSSLKGKLTRLKKHLLRGAS